VTCWFLASVTPTFRFLFFVACAVYARTPPVAYASDGVCWAWRWREVFQYLFGLIILQHPRPNLEQIAAVLGYVIVAYKQLAYKFLTALHPYHFHVMQRSVVAASSVISPAT